MSEYLKEYLGDGVYVALDDSRGFILTTENGIGATNTIILEPDVYEALEVWVRRAIERVKRHDSGEERLDV